nr:hypothetical protein FFPRI1PSEUD_44180 [Pseudomonas sp. FFPRI_1]
MNRLRLPPRAGLWAGALLLLAGWFGWLGHGTWQFSQRLHSVQQPMPVQTPTAPPAVLDSAAIARLFGVLPAEASGNQPRVPLNLLASLVERHPEQSRALIESPEGSRFYRIGEALPGGGSLRRIGPQEVSIQRFGEEQSLSLAPTSTLLVPLPPDGRDPTSRTANAGGALQSPSSL